MNGKIQEDDVAELFHENTRITPYDVGISLGHLPALEPGVVLERHRLPTVAAGEGVALERAIERRVTSRAFDPEAILAQELLARLLALGCGFTTRRTGVPRPEFRRAAPSAGATYPLDVYAIVRRVAGLAPGVYRYAVEDHSLELLRPGQFHGELPAWTLDQPYIADTSIVFAIAGSYGRIRPRYHERGYRYMLLEAGHVAQNLYLLSTAHRLGALADGGFVDAAIDRLLGLDGTAHAALYLVAVGVPKAREQGGAG